MAEQRVWLDVPYAEKDEAKQHGARWDPAAKRWYAPRPGIPGLQRWAALPEIPDVLPGEDRTFGSGLFVDPVPASCWFTNVCTCVIPRDWERLHRMITRRAGHRCEICGRAPDRAAGLRLEAHERWAYNEHASVQALRRLICLCRGLPPGHALRLRPGQRPVRGRLRPPEGRHRHDRPPSPRTHR